MHLPHFQASLLFPQDQCTITVTEQDIIMGRPAYMMGTIYQD